MATFWKAFEYDRQTQHVYIWRDTRDMVDEIAEIKNINSTVLFVSWSTF